MTPGLVGPGAATGPLGALLIAAALLFGSGCAPSRGAFPGGGAPPPDVVEIEVVNRHFNQAEIWALGLGGRRRLGIVQGKATETFTLPWATSGYLRLEMQVLSSGTCLTGELETDPGDLLYLEVPLEPRNDPSCR